MLNVEDAALVVIDVQGKLAQLMHEKEVLFDNVKRIIKGAQVLKVPILLTEQNPAGLGHTLPDIASLLDVEAIAKFHFSCCGEGAFMQALEGLGRRQILLAGIETHVCVYQTAADLVRLGYDVHVLADAVSSRAESNKRMGLEKMKDAGANLTSVETALFELLKVARGEKFKQVIKI
ncbi:MAG: hydrolase, partial [Phycisphaerae bacterium]|nr:hydrolase [Phycisphaerae bacterium]